MADKSWMLHPQAVRYAYDCIHIIQGVDGVRLKLSQPDFLQQLHERVERIQSPELGETYAKLIAMGGVGTVLRELKPASASDNSVVPKKAVGAETYNDVVNSDEIIEFNGQSYSRFRDGREFKGLYRGMPRYA